MFNTIRGAVPVAVAAFLLLGVPGQSQAQLVLYDNFNGKRIDPSKWQGGEFVIPGAPHAETARRIEDGKLELSLTSYGTTLSDSGTAGITNTRLQVTSPAAVTTLQAAVTVMSATVNGCAANMMTATRARANLFGSFFNDGTSPGPGNLTGDIRATLHKVRDSILGDRIEAFLNRCTNAACSSTAQLGFHVFTTVWEKEEADTLRVQWDSPNNQFLYTVNPGLQGEETVALGYAVPDALLPVFAFKQLSVANSVASCTTGRPSATIKARFDNVRVNR